MAGARERARAETMADIRRIARRQLAEDGAAGVSLRAIAREIGMVSSAVYRYVASRDDLLTLLIIESYEALGEVAEAADASVVDRGDLLGRWMAVCRDTRVWARANPADYGLIYGTPVPGYAAPIDTVPAATRFTNVLAGLMVEADAEGCIPQRPPIEIEMAADVAADMARLGERAGLPIDPELSSRGLMAWSQLMGAISLELFGHLHNVVDHPAEFFEHAMATTGSLLGLRGNREPERRR